MAFIVKAGPTGRGELYFMFTKTYKIFFRCRVCFVIYVARGLGGCEIIIRSWWGERIFILYMEGDMKYILDYSYTVLQ